MATTMSSKKFYKKIRATPPSILLELYPELWLMVLDYLEYYDLLTISVVSKQFQQLTNFSMFDRKMFRGPVSTTGKETHLALPRPKTILNPFLDSISTKCTKHQYLDFITDLPWYNSLKTHHLRLQKMMHMKYRYSALIDLIEEGKASVPVKRRLYLCLGEGIGRKIIIEIENDGGVKLVDVVCAVEAAWNHGIAALYGRQKLVLWDDSNWDDNLRLPWSCIGETGCSYRMMTVPKP